METFESVEAESGIQRDVPVSLIRCKDFIVGHFPKDVCNSEQESFLEWIKERAERVASRLTVYIYRNYIVGSFDAEVFESTSQIVPGDACHYISFSSADNCESAIQIARKNPACSVVQISGAKEFEIARGESGAQVVYYIDLESKRLALSNLVFLNRAGLMISHSAINFYLRFFYVPAPHTIYESVFSLLPSEKVNFVLGRNLTREPFSQYHEGRLNKLSPKDIEKTLEIFESQLRYSCEKYKAVALEEESKALLLSGGKDSSGLAIGLSGSQSKPNAINVSFDDECVSEQEDASTVANALGYSYSSYRVSDEAAQKQWGEFCRALGQPMADPAALPLFLLLNSDSGRFDWFIDGTGNDKYFGLNPPRSSRILWWSRRCLKKLGIDGVIELLAKNKMFNDRAKKLGNPAEEQYVSWNGFNYEEIRELVVSKCDWVRLPLYEVYGESRSPGEHMTKTVCCIWEPECAFRKLVQFAKASGKNVFYPYLDRDLEALVLNILPGYRNQGNTNKVLLRELLRKHLPKSVVDKKKGSFIFSKKKFLNSQFNSDFEKLWLAENWQQLGLSYLWPLVENTLAAHECGDRSVEGRVYAVYLLFSWLCTEQEAPSNLDQKLLKSVSL